MNLGDGSFSIGGTTWPGISKLIKEMGELGQVIGKLIATHGDPGHWDGSDLVERLHEELGDVEAAIQFLKEVNGLDQDQIDARREKKVALFRTWHEEQGG